MENTVLKNGFHVNEVPWSIYKKQKKNQVFKLLPLREEEQDWKLQLETVLVEIGGITKLTEYQEYIAMTIMFKLSGLRNEDLDFFLYRKTIFEIISLLEEW